MLADELARTTSSSTVAIPLECTDGFNEAYYGRTDGLLAPPRRVSCR